MDCTYFKLYSTRIDWQYIYSWHLYIYKADAPSYELLMSLQMVYHRYLNTYIKLSQFYFKRRENFYKSFELTFFLIFNVHALA